MKVWIIITSSLLTDMYNVRKKEYMNTINKVIEKFNDKNKYNIVIVENTSLINKSISHFSHRTFLDSFGVPVYYTKNNLILKHTSNYGIIELIDIFDCINHFQILDDDFIVKLTGRYSPIDDSPFFEVLSKLDETPYSAIVRFGEYDGLAVLEKNRSIATGLVGLKCKYVKQIEIPSYSSGLPIEYSWAKVVCSLNQSEICMMEKLGILVRPKHHKSFDYVCM